MNELSVSGQKAAQNLQIEYLNLKLKITNYFFIPVRPTRSSIPLNVLNL